jgi:hypothetical protein
MCGNWRISPIPKDVPISREPERDPFTRKGRFHSVLLALGIARCVEAIVSRIADYEVSIWGQDREQL